MWNEEMNINVVVVGLVFQQKESVKSELIEKLFIGSYSSRWLLISKFDIDVWSLCDIYHINI